MKRFICAVLCLSVLFSLILGVVTAFAASPTFYPARASYKISGCKLTGYGYDAESKKGYYAHLKVYVAGHYRRGAGMTNAGQVYHKFNDKEEKSKARWYEVKSVEASVTGNNAMDDLYDHLVYARKWWTVD